MLAGSPRHFVLSADARFGDALLSFSLLFSVTEKSPRKEQHPYPSRSFDREFHHCFTHRCKLREEGLRPGHRLGARCASMAAGT